MYTGNDLRENKNYFESSRRFGLSRVGVAEGKNYSKRMKEIKGKSILVRVSEIRLYSEIRSFHYFFL